MGFLLWLLSSDPWKGKDDPYFFPTSTSWWSVPLSFCSLADALCKMAFHKLMTFADFQEEIRYSWRRGKRIGGRGSSQHRALMHIGCWCGCQRNQHTHRARTHNHEDDEGGSAIIIYLLISSLREILCAVINCKPIKKEFNRRHPHSERHDRKFLADFPQDKLAVRVFIDNSNIFLQLKSPTKV